MQYKISARHYDELHFNESELLSKKLFNYFNCQNNLNLNILDLGCGTGTVLHELKKLGIVGFMQGIDLSEEMISEAKRKDSTIDFKTSDVLQFDTSYKSFFDLVLSTHNVINYIHPKKLNSFFKRISLALNSKGLAYVDFDCEYDFISLWPNYVQTDKGEGWEVCRSNYYDSQSGKGTEKQDWKITTEENNSVMFTETHTLYPITPSSIVEVAKSSDLRLIEFIDPNTFKKRSENIDREIMLAGVFRKV